MTELTIVQGDQKYITFKLREPDGTTPTDISGADTINFRMKKYGETTLSASGTCSIVDGTAGTCRYFMTTLDTARTGNFYSEVEVIEGNEIITWIGPTIKIVDQLG